MSKMPEKAMVMAAGLGLRMRPLSDMPKPLIEVGGISLIDRCLDWLSASGVKQVVINTHYRADVMQKHLSGRTYPEVITSHETELLETGGGLVRALPLLGDEPFFAINSDVICLDGRKPALKNMAKLWDPERMDALLLLHPVARAVGYDKSGDFFMDDNGLITRPEGRSNAPYVFTGIQLLHPRLFENAPSGKFSLNVLYDRAMKKETGAAVYGLVHDGAWLHVGDPSGVTQAESYLQRVVQSA